MSQQVKETNWAAIKEVTGMDDDTIAMIQRNWSLPPQTEGQVREGVLAERDRRENATSRRLRREQRKGRSVRGTG